MVRKNVHECEDCRVTIDQNVPGSGFFGKSEESTLGSVFAKFYGISHFPLYSEVKVTSFFIRHFENYIPSNLRCGSRLMVSLPGSCSTDRVPSYLIRPLLQQGASLGLFLAVIYLQLRNEVSRSKSLFLRA